MGQYGYTKVENTVIRVDVYPHPILMETESFVDFTNGRALSFPQGVMVVVGHSNTEGWGPDYYHRTIYVVPTSNWHPELNPDDGQDAIIGHYKTSPNQWGKTYEYPVKRYKHSAGDGTIRACLEKEGRWPLD